MGTTLSAQWDSKCEEDEERYSGLEEVSEDSTEDELHQKKSQISSHSGKTENQTDEMNSESETMDLVDVASGFVTLSDDVPDTANSIHEGDVSQTSTDNSSKQINNTDDIIVKVENEANSKLNDTEICLKKIFKFGGFKFTLKKDKVEKTDADEPIENQQDKNATVPPEESWDNTDVNPVSINNQDVEKISNERMGCTSSAFSPETHNEMTVGSVTPDKGLMDNVPQRPEPEELMSPIKRFFSQRGLAGLRKKRKEEETLKENEEELKVLYKVVEKETTKEDTACTCLDVSMGTFDKEKDIQLYKKDEHRPAEVEIMGFLEKDKVQASPLKKLFRKLSMRRQSEIKPGDTNVPESGDSEKPQLSTDLVKSQKEQETQTADEMMDISHEESKKKSDSTVSWENLICVRSAKTRARKTSDSEEETQDKGEMPRKTTESPHESSTEGDHLTSSNEQGGSHAEEDSGSAWKSFKKLVTPKRKSRLEESGSVEQMQSDTEITKDESSCSLRKLISGSKKIKPDGQQEIISSDEVSKDTGTDIEDDDTPGVIPLFECERAEPEISKVMTKRTSENTEEIQPIIEEDRPKQIQSFYTVNPLCVDAGVSGVLIPTEYMDELTEFLSKHQQLSDIPEEEIIEESVASPQSFVEWITQDDTTADDIADLTADAVTAPEPSSEHNEDETTEMVSAVSQLSESPITSGNVTPISAVYDMRESDAIFQDVVESVCMDPSVLSITTNDKVPEVLVASVSELIVDSTKRSETKVLVNHKKADAISIHIGVVSQELRATEIVLPLPLVEGISEITSAVQKEFVSDDLAVQSESAGTVTDNIYEAEFKELKTILHKVLLLDEQSTVLAETVRKANQQIRMDENIWQKVSPVVQMENVENETTVLIHGINEFTPFLSTANGGTQLLEKQIITINMKGPQTEGPLQPALEEPINEQKEQNNKIPIEVEKDLRSPDIASSIADVKQHPLVAITGPVACSVVESVSDRSLNGVSIIIEDDIHVTEVAKSVLHSVLASESEFAMNQALEIVEDLTGILESDLKCLESTLPVSNVIPTPDSIQIEMDLENGDQRKNNPLLHFVDNPTIQVKLNNTELQAAKKNAETVHALGTTLDAEDFFENTEMIGKEGKSKQMIEPTSVEMIDGIVEKIVYNFEAENLCANIDKSTEKRKCKESELNQFCRDVALPVATTNEENANKVPGVMSKMMLTLEKEQTEIESVVDEVYILMLNTYRTREETKQPPAISEQTSVSEDGIHPPTTNSNPDSQPTFSRVIADTITTAKAPGPLRLIKRPCGHDESDIPLVEKHKQNETANSEVTTKQETVETVKPFHEAEPHLDPDEPPSECLSSKPEKSRVTELRPKPYQENNPIDEALVEMTETFSTITFMYEQETGVEGNISVPCVGDQSVLFGTRFSEKQEDNETVNAEMIHQGTVEKINTFLKAEAERQPQKESLYLKPELSQEIESSHEPYEDNNQIIGTVEITEPISSVIYEEETEVEYKMFDQPLETGQCFKGIVGVPESTMEHVNEIHLKDKDESPECFIISETNKPEHVMEVLKANMYQVSVEVVREHEVEMALGYKANTVSPDGTEQEVSEIDINAAVTEKNIDLTAALKLKEETTMIISDEQTVVTSEKLVESPSVTENKLEPETNTCNDLTGNRE